MSSSDLHNGIEFLRLCFERRLKLSQRGNQRPLDGFQRRNVHRGGNDVVAGLPHVDVIVRMNRILRTDDSAEHLDGTIGNDFVRVHVRGGSRTGLEDIENKVLIELAVDHFLGGFDDRVADLLVQKPKIHVGVGPPRA